MDSAASPLEENIIDVLDRGCDPAKLLDLYNADPSIINKVYEPNNVTPLLKAIQKTTVKTINAYKPCIKFFLDNEADVNVADSDGNTPLILACEKGLLSIVAMLLDKNPNLNAFNKDGISALHACIKTTDEEISAVNSEMIAVMILDKAMVNNVDIFNIKNSITGVTPLMWAIIKDNQTMFDFFIEKIKKEDIDISDNKGMTAFLHACKELHYNGTLHYALSLIEHGANIHATNNDGQTAIDLLNVNQDGHNAELIKELKDKISGTNLGAAFDDAASDQEDPEIIQLLYDDDVTVDQLRSLIEKDPEQINAEDRREISALIIACEKNNVEIVTLLLDNGAKITTRDYESDTGFTPLLAWAKNSGGNDITDLSMLDLFLDRGLATINDTTDHGYTILSLFIEAGKNEFIQELIDKGANINKPELKVFSSSKDNPIPREELDVTPEQGEQEEQREEQGEEEQRGEQEEDVPFENYSFSNVVGEFPSDSDISAIAGLNSFEKPSDDEEASDSEEASDDEASDDEVSDDEASDDNYSTVSSYQGDVWGSKLSLPQGVLFSPLFSAISLHNRQALNILLENKVNIDEFVNNFTPLMLVCKKRLKEIVKLLIEKGAKINEQNESGDNALIIATTNSDKTLVEMLLGAGADVNLKNKKGTTPLIISCDVDNLAIAELLLDKGADVNVSTDQGDTPLISACNNRNVKLVELLIESGANVNAETIDGFTPLIISCNKNDTVISKILLERNANVNVKTNDGVTPLTACCENNNTELIILLLDRGANVNDQTADGETPLLYAINNESLEIVKLLVEKGADVNIVGEKDITPLIFICDSSIMTIDILQVLLEKGANVNDKNEYGITPLIAACENPSVTIEILQLLLEKGANANVNDKNKYGITPLIGACENPSITVEILQLLLEKGANVNDKNEYGITPFIAACRNPGVTIGILQFLLQQKKDFINDKNIYGDTPFLIVCRNQSMKIDILQFLLEEKPDFINDKKENGDTPFLNVCSNPSITVEILEFLLQKKPQSINDGKSVYPLLVACSNPNITVDILKFLFEKDEEAIINKPPHNGLIPLSAACGNPKITYEVLQFLFDKNPEAINVKVDGDTLLMYAVKRGNPVSVKFLLTKNVFNINEMDSNDLNPLLYSCMKRSFEIVKLLVEAGADINVTQQDGYTCLMYTDYENEFDNNEYVEGEINLVNEGKKITKFLKSKKAIETKFNRREPFNLDPISNKQLPVYTGQPISIKPYQTVMDFIEGTEINILEYVKKPDNIVLKYEDSYFLTTRTQLRTSGNMENTDNSVVFDCKKVGTLKDVVRDKPYLVLTSLGVVFEDSELSHVILLEDAIAMQKEESGHFFVVLLTDEVLVSTTTDNVLNGLFPNAISAPHCQEGKSAIAYKIEKFTPVSPSDPDSGPNPPSDTDSGPGPDPPSDPNLPSDTDSGPDPPSDPNLPSDTDSGPDPPSDPNLPSDPGADPDQDGPSGGSGQSKTRKTKKRNSIKKTRRVKKSKSNTKSNKKKKPVGRVTRRKK